MWVRDGGREYLSLESLALEFGEGGGDLCLGDEWGLGGEVPWNSRFSSSSDGGR